MTGGSISGNTSQGTGDSARAGGLLNGTNTLTTTLSGVTIANNVATAGTSGEGGGIADGANVPISISGCTITGNQADSGGGVAVVSSGLTQTATISNSVSFSGNTATTGSAIYVSAGIAALSGTNTISGDIAVVTNSSAALTAASGSTTNLTGNLTMGAGTITGNNSTFNITGAYSQSGGTFNGNTSTFTISNGSTLSGGTFNNGTNYNVTGTLLLSGATYNGGGTTTLSGAGNFTQSSGTFSGGSGTINLVGNFSYTGGTFTAGTSTFNFNGTGAQSASNSSLITFNNLTDSNTTQPLTFNNSFNVNGNLTANGANATLNPVAAAAIGGSGTLTGTGIARVTRATGTNDFLTQYTITNKTLTNLLVDYVGAAAQGISGTTYTNVRLNNASGGTLSAPATVNGTLTLASGAFNVGTSTLTLNGAVTLSGGSLTSGATGTVIYNQSTNGQQVVSGTYGNLTFSNFNKDLTNANINIAGTFTPGSGSATTTGSTITFNGSSAQTIPVFNYNNLGLNNAAGASLSGSLAVGGSLTLTNGTLAVGTNTLTLNGGGSQTAGTITSSTTGTVIYNQSSNGQAVLTGNYGNLTFSNFNKVLPAGTIGISGTFTPGTATGHTVTGNTIDFNGAGAQTIPAFNYNNLTSSNSGARTLASSGTIGIAGAFTPGTNSYTATGSTIDFNGTGAQTIPGASYNNLTISGARGGATVTLANGGTINVAGAFSPTATSVVYASTGNTFVFNAAGAQNIPAFASFNNLSTGGSGTKTLTGNVAAAGTLTIGSGTTLDLNGFTLTAGGNWNNNGTFTPGTGTVVFNGSSSQTIGGANPTTFNALTINNGAGVVLNFNTTVNGLLTLQNGNITTGANTLIIGGSGSISHISGHTIGNLRKVFSGPGSFTFAVGTAGAYSPVDVTVTAGSGNLDIKANAGTAPATPALDPTKMLQRYWTLSGSGITSNVVFHYLDADVPGTSTESAYSIFRIITGGTALRFNPDGTNVILDTAANTFTINSLSNYSDWTAGNPLAPTAAPASISGRVMTADGQPIYRARVTIIGQNGQPLSALTNAFGYYSIDGIETGATYLMTIEHKQYRFNARTITVNDNISNYDIVAEP
jgi:hypothetical protein